MKAIRTRSTQIITALWEHKRSLLGELREARRLIAELRPRATEQLPGELAAAEPGPSLALYADDRGYRLVEVTE